MFYVVFCFVYLKKKKKNGERKLSNSDFDILLKDLYRRKERHLNYNHGENINSVDFAKPLS